MNREIKFKVWDSEFKIWIWNLGMKSNNVLTDGVETGRYKVCEYTGLKDKNAKEIYEGDIVKSATVIDAIGYIQGAFVWANEPLGNFEADNEDFETKCWAEIIGNIYQHPELIS